MIDKSSHNSISNDEWLNSYFADKTNLECLMILKSYDVVSLHYYDGNPVPGFISINSDAYALLHEIYNNKVEKRKSFRNGVLSAVICELLIILLSKIL